MTWYEVRNADTIPSPALLVYPDRILDNIRQTIRMASHPAERRPGGGHPAGGGPDRLRPHVKTHKMRAVTDLLLAEGIRQFKCATLKESRMLAEAGAPDVLLAYPLVGPATARLAGLRAEFPAVQFSCLIDASLSAQHLSDTFGSDPLDVYIDLNVGMNRTGIVPADAPTLYAFCRTLPGIRVVGLHAYDGHLHQTDLPLRTHQADETFALADGVRQSIADRYDITLSLVMGGTPTFALHARHPDVTVSPGTFVFWDAGYGQLLPDLPFDVAAVLLMRVISVIDEHTLCLDLGHKSVAAENPLPRVVFLGQPDAVPIGQSEEHLVVRVADVHQHPPGTVWYGIPVHICPTVNLYDSVSVIIDNQCVDSWPVTARGH